MLTDAREKVDELHLKAGYAAIFGGSAKTLAEASNNFVIALVLAVLFIYMVLASQFNSFVHPLTIMTSLPLSLPAGLLALMAFGMTLNVYSAIGLMMLFGIVKKNSILQVDYTNTLRNQGMNRYDAIIAANHVRLRPILMTTIAIVAGMIPIAFGRGAGAGIARVDGRHDHRGPGALPAADVAGDPGRLLVFRRPEGLEPSGNRAATRQTDAAQAEGGGSVTVLRPWTLDSDLRPQPKDQGPRTKVDPSCPSRPSCPSCPSCPARFPCQPSDAPDPSNRL